MANHALTTTECVVASILKDVPNPIAPLFAIREGLIALYDVLKDQDDEAAFGLILNEIRR